MYFIDQDLILILWELYTSNTILLYYLVGMPKLQNKTWRSHNKIATVSVKLRGTFITHKKPFRMKPWDPYVTNFWYLICYVIKTLKMPKHLKEKCWEEDMFKKVEGTLSNLIILLGVLRQNSTFKWP